MLDRINLGTNSLRQGWAQGCWSLESLRMVLHHQIGRDLLAEVLKSRSQLSEGIAERPTVDSSDSLLSLLALSLAMAAIACAKPLEHGLTWQ